MFVDLYQKKSLTDPTLLQSIAEFQGPQLGHFPLLETMTKWPNGGPWALVWQKWLSKMMALLPV